MSTLNAAEVGHRFTTTAGTHFVRVVGIPSTASRSGSFGVEIKAVSGGATVFQSVELLSLSAADVQGRAVIAENFTAPAAGNYEVSLADLQLPQSLQTLTLAITRPGSTDVFTMNAAGTQTFALQAAVYQIFVIGQAQSSPNAGLFSVTVRSIASGANVFTKTTPIGAVAALGTASTSAGAYNLTLSDFAFPAPLARSGVVISRDGTVAASLAAPGTVSFSAASGDYSVFAYASTTTGGSYGVEVRPQVGAAIFSTAQTAGGAPGAIPSFAYPIDIVTAGAYRVRLSDFEFPGQLATLSLAASQNGALTNSISAPGSLDLNLTAGRVFLLVIANPAAAGGALFGLDIKPAAGGTALFETTQGVGSLFSVRKVSIATAGQYNVALQDLAFPRQFQDLAAVVTRGGERAESIFGGGSFGFSATPGDYFINFIAQGNLIDEQLSQTLRAGTYAMAVASAPAAPTITLTANPGQVRNGGTAQLTWSTQNATSCTASGGWTGSKAMQGSEQTAAITTSTAFKLTCTGAGGSTDQSVSVGISSSTSTGGGGALEWLTLAALLCAWQVALRIRFRQ